MGDNSLRPAFGLEDVKPYWPQRLLHVISMTSFPRKNVGGEITYGGHPFPSYNILSYTWGRYRVQEKGEGGGTAIEVWDESGEPWYIPPMRPEKREGFNSKEFKRAIDSVAQGVKFVWVDVACIPQVNKVHKIPQTKKDADDSAFEVGRQAGIFKRAKNAYIWIHSLRTKELNEAIERLSKYELGLINDQWFSSLWTLQEASLRKDSILLSRQGETIDADDQGHPVKLRHIIQLFSRYLKNQETDHYEFNRLCGLEMLVGKNPVPLLSVAKHREVSGNKNDRIYGIMQVFDINVGGKDVDDLDELSLMFYREMNRKSPVVSQAFTHSAPRDDGDPSWAPKIGDFDVGTPGNEHVEQTYQFDNTQIVPPLFYDMVEVPVYLDYRAVFRPHPQQVKLLRFQGYAFSLNYLLRILRCSTPDLETKNTPTCSVWLDSQYMPHGQVGNVFDPVSRRVKNRDTPKPISVAKALINKTEDEDRDRDILHMGRFDTGGQKGFLGIVVSQRRPTSQIPKKATWVREGFCTWEKSNGFHFRELEEVERDLQ